MQENSKKTKINVEVW